MMLNDTAAIVTGGASGLGAATAHELRSKGARVTIFDLDAMRGADFAAQIGADYASVDVTSAESVQTAIDTAFDKMGSITALVNCAGIAPAERVLGKRGPHSFEHFKNVMDVNLSGTFNMIRLCVEKMALNEGPARGVIVNTASVAAFDGQKGQAAYAASKAGVAGMTLPLARDLATHGIRVCAIAPGIFKTPMLEGLPEEVQQSLAADVIFPNRLGDPAEFAALARFILECDYLNGETIRLDGALRMR